MIKVLGIEHIGVALSDNKQLSNLFKNIFNLQYIGSEVVEDQGVNTDIFNASNTKIELLEAISDDSPISKYISKYGQGMHHLALLVEDIDAAIKYLIKNNIEMIDKEPKIGVEGYKIAFIHPKSTPGLLIEICQK
tara:strand:+ start:374 stop:778 length:405 start_codon:yes stop_codon:yes gene_type:complete